MNDTAISWTKVTWNPTHGCHKISEGCRNCYAATLSLKYGWTKQPWTAPHAAENVQMKPHKLREPYKLREPSRIFVNSMSDLGHELIPDSYLADVFAVMADLPQHTFQVLTKRPERFLNWSGPWTPNIHMGVSVEDPRAQRRIDVLRQVPAAVRFLSVEPLIARLSPLNLDGISWVIVGGESGPGHRPMPHAWARDVRDACLEEEVAFFFKQSAASRTEMGTSLRHEDGSFWKWAQFPGEMIPPTQAVGHRFADE